jgi:hypothetical protein
VLLTDTLAFIWQYCLGWWEPQDLDREQLLIMDGLAEGRLYRVSSAKIPYATIHQHG